MKPRSLRGARPRRALNLDAMTDDRELSEEVVKLLRARHEIPPASCPHAMMTTRRI